MEKRLNEAHRQLAVEQLNREKRAAELDIANQELLFQKREKKDRAAELVLADKELLYQSREKRLRAQELSVANKELAYQNQEKEHRAEELVVANKELAFQNKEKESRAQELIIANKELAFQNEEKEKRAAQLQSAYRQLEAFNYITSHDLQEPLRKLQMFASRMLMDEDQVLSVKSRDHLNRMSEAALHIQSLIIDLRTYSVASATSGEHKNTDVNEIIGRVVKEFKALIQETNAVVEVSGSGHACVVAFQFQQLIAQLLDNSFKFARPGVPPHIKISTRMLPYTEAPELLPLEKDYCHIQIVDNGIGFDPAFCEQVFEIFKRLHERKEHAGTGIGLAIAKKIVENHQGIIFASGDVETGATFDIYIPVDSAASSC